MISNILRKHFLVEVFLQKRHGKGSKRCNVCIFGTPENVQMARYVYSFLTATFQRLWITYKRENNVRMCYKSAFQMGLMRGLSDKLTENEEKFKGTYGIVPLNQAVAKCREQYNIRHSSTSINGNDAIRNDGYVKGRQLNIAKPVGHSSSNNGLMLGR
jgi:hypothetical protein